mgnify:CR=1 FL=1
MTVETTARKNKDREEEAMKAAGGEKGAKSETWMSRAARLGASSWDEITGGPVEPTESPAGAGAGAAPGVYVPRSLRKGADGSRPERGTHLSEPTWNLKLNHFKMIRPPSALQTFRRIPARKICVTFANDLDRYRESIWPETEILTNLEALPSSLSSSKRTPPER